MFAIATLALSAAAAAEPSLDPRYQACIEGVKTDLEAGRSAAQQWAAEGGGAMAQHCLAVADLAAGFPKLAAARLQSITERNDAGDNTVRAKILAQSAEAWLEAELPENAETVVEQAFDLTPDAGELHLVAAKIYELQDRPLDVIKSVDAAEALNLGSAAGFVARGRAQFKTGNYEAAAHDVVRALSLDPRNIDALVLRGELRQTGIAIDVDYAGSR